MFPAVPDGCLSRGKAPAYTNGSYRSNSPRMHRHDSTGSETLTRLNQNRVSTCRFSALRCAVRPSHFFLKVLVPLRRI